MKIIKNSNSIQEPSPDFLNFHDFQGFAANLATDASGAALGGQNGFVVLVVDVIDFSTSMEAALGDGAVAVWGASPRGARPPVEVNPFWVGCLAGRQALLGGTDVVLVAEPRYGLDEDRVASVEEVSRGIKYSGAALGALVPNIGAEVVRLCGFSGRVVVGVSATGGVAFDAALAAGAPAVLTGTVARTLRHKGTLTARLAAERGLAAARSLNTGITVVAASKNSLEDVLAAEYIYKLILEQAAGEKL